MTRFGITIPIDDRPLRSQRARFTRLVEFGYTDVWSAEVDATDAFTPLTLAAA
jgi:hypothetical protein